MHIRKYPVSEIGYYFLSVALCLGVIVSCARQGFPPGGPEDKTAPEAVRINPEPLSTNVSIRESILFEFSEPMNEQSVTDNLFISPIPSEWPKAFWREGGKILTLDFPDQLRKDATYIITVGAKATDRQNNPLQESIVLTFSTGPEIEQGIIRGTVMPWTYFGPSSENVAGVDVAAYRLSDAAPPPDPRENAPDYVTQTGADGAFSLAGVSSGKYRLYAIGDKDRNGFYSPGYDMIGIPSRDIVLARGDTLIFAPPMVISEMDTASVQFSAVRPIDSHRFEIFFDSAVDPNAFDIGVDDLSITGWFVPAGELKKVSVATSEQQNAKTYAISKLNLRGRDGNLFAPSENPLTFTGIDRSDTTALVITDWEPKILTPGNDPVRLVFNRVLSFSDTLHNSIAKASEGTVSATRSGMNCLDIIPSDRWNPAIVYHITFDRENLRGAAGNRLSGTGPDISFRVAPEDTLGFISGSVSDTVETETTTYRLQFKNLDFGIVREVKLTEQGEWKANALLPGRYVALGHRDDDGDGEIYRGSVYPYKPAEPVCALPDTILVEPGETSGGVRFLFR